MDNKVDCDIRQSLDKVSSRCVEIIVKVEN